MEIRGFIISTSHYLSQLHRHVNFFHCLPFQYFDRANYLKRQMKYMKKNLVWDIPVRLFHWLLVLCLFGQWLTTEMLNDAMDIHFYIGHFTLGLIISPLIWRLLALCTPNLIVLSRAL